MAICSVIALSLGAPATAACQHHEEIKGDTSVEHADSSQQGHRQEPSGHGQVLHQGLGARPHQRVATCDSSSQRHHDRAVAERKPEAHGDWCLAAAQQLAGHVVYSGQVVAVHRMPKAQDKCKARVAKHHGVRNAELRCGQQGRGPQRRDRCNQQPTSRQDPGRGWAPASIAVLDLQQWLIPRPRRLLGLGDHARPEQMNCTTNWQCNTGPT
mmetsp:Transcript_3075/g.8238  ORF Transcript_3075/g.8238 Transcript_3075/m.8238 type:complete len:212 (-) Transcript_3075:85-720(-)